MFFAQSTAKGHIRAKQNIGLFLPQLHTLINELLHLPSLMIAEKLGEGGGEGR